MIQPVLSQLRYPLRINLCKIQPKPVAANKTPSERPRTIRSRCNMMPRISFVPRMFPCACQFFAAICIIKIAMPSQNKVKNPWKGESALAAFCLWLLSESKFIENERCKSVAYQRAKKIERDLSNAVNCLVKTKSLNFFLRFGSVELFSCPGQLFR
jgi:hypothetical protein